ncbi:hypothetical protein CSC2_16900 [Clostridium zeae]|uniref:Uncharacterized protein n=1 Tax=Clostridium zeae TaxID=2759022 RepID=A0ABQ1E8T5_9CLOT|nr:hypothetical protein CSC2_16900 [Clostridium zeae]
MYTAEISIEYPKDILTLAKYNTIITNNNLIIDRQNVDKTGMNFLFLNIFSPITAAKMHNNRLAKALIP